MPDDLIIKFFKEDLTEAEESALSDRLMASTEDAARFGQHAEASYRHYGLPEPEWPGGGAPKGFYPLSRIKLWLLFAAASLAGLSAWVAWMHWLGSQNQPSLSASAGLAANPGPGSVVKTHPATEEAVIPDHLERSAVATQKDSDSPEEGASPMLTPVNIAAQPHRPRANFEAIVRRGKAGQVTVRVMGPDGNQAVLLYQGMLQPGNWAFDWDGRLAKGEAPPKGAYQIQVVSEAVTLSKSVMIR